MGDFGSIAMGMMLGREERCFFSTRNARYSLRAPIPLAACCGLADCERSMPASGGLALEDHPLPLIARCGALETRAARGVGCWLVGGG